MIESKSIKSFVILYKYIKFPQKSSRRNFIRKNKNKIYRKFLFFIQKEFDKLNFGFNCFEENDATIFLGYLLNDLLMNEIKNLKFKIQKKEEYINKNFTKNINNYGIHLNIDIDKNDINIEFDNTTNYSVKFYKELLKRNYYEIVI